MTDANTALIDRIESPASAKGTNKKTAKAEGSLTPTQQAHETALASSASSAKDGRALAVTDAKSFALSYAQTTQKLAPIVDKEVKKARALMSTAITSVTAEDAVEGADDSDFLSDFESELSALVEA